MTVRCTWRIPVYFPFLYKVLLARHKAEDVVYAVKVLQKQQIRKNNEIRHIMSERNVRKQSIDQSSDQSVDSSTNQSINRA